MAATGATAPAGVSPGERDEAGFTCFDLRARTAGGLEVLFPGWRPGDEHVVALSPHDDDALLGAGYALLAALAGGARASVLIFCSGNAGYSDPAQRDTIVETRRGETAAAYAALGLAPEDVARLDYPDFSVLQYVGWQLPSGGEGTFARTIPYLRRAGATRLLVPNGYREHVDHSAVAAVGGFDAPQVGDAIVAEWGAAAPVRSVLEYAVWGDFSPEDALVHGASAGVRANRALVAPAAAEARVAGAVQAFRSQQRIIAGLLNARRARRLADGRGVEVYRWFDPRPALDYAPYRRLVQEIAGAAPP